MVGLGQIYFNLMLNIVTDYNNRSITGQKMNTESGLGSNHSEFLELETGQFAAVPLHFDNIKIQLVTTKYCFFKTSLEATMS